MSKAKFIHICVDRAMMWMWFVVCSAVKEISDLLNTGLDDETLRICVQLLEAGINPEALADVVKELRREMAAIRVRNKSYYFVQGRTPVLSNFHATLSLGLRHVSIACMNK